MFQCRNLYRYDNPIYFLKSDYDIQCWTEEHKFWTFSLATPAAIFWAIVLPICMFFFLRKQRHRLDAESNRMKYAYLYRGYNSKKYFWEFVILIRKYLLIAITVFGTFRTSDFQIYFAIFVIWFAYALQLRYHPYFSISLNNLEKTGLTCAALVNFTGLYFFFSKTSVALDFTFLFISFVANAYFGYRWLREFLIVQRNRVIEMLAKSAKMRARFMKYKLLRKIFKLEAKNDVVSPEKKEEEIQKRLEDILNNIQNDEQKEDSDDEMSVSEGNRYDLNAPIKPRKKVVAAQDDGHISDRIMQADEEAAQLPRHERKRRMLSKKLVKTDLPKEPDASEEVPQFVKFARVTKHLTDKTEKNGKGIRINVINNEERKDASNPDDIIDISEFLGEDYDDHNSDVNSNVLSMLKIVRERRAMLSTNAAKTTLHGKDSSHSLQQNNS